MQRREKSRNLRKYRTCEKKANKMQFAGYNVNGIRSYGRIMRGMYTVYRISPLYLYFDWLLAYGLFVIAQNSDIMSN